MAWKCTFLSARLIFVLAVTGALLAGCAPWPQESDWQWRQWNPDYRLPYPGDQGAH